MGKIAQGVFGGSRSKQSSSASNRAYDSLNTAFSPLYGQATQGAKGLSDLLSGDSTGFDKYKDATGFDWAAEQGSRGITGNAAARGLLRSGSTGKSLVTFGNGIQDQFATNYMDKLLQQAQLGFNAGNLVSGAGSVSTSKGSSSTKPGIGGFLGKLASGAAASDIRLKKNIFKVGELDNGLNVYQYRYLGEDDGTHIGVMAQEVKEIMPEALGPEISGYMTVNYDVIREAA
jgi:hypothetical protein